MSKRMSKDRQAVTEALGYCLAHTSPDSEPLERTVVEWVVEHVEAALDRGPRDWNH